MDSKSQTSAEGDIINEFSRSCSCSTLSDTTFCNSSGCCAKDIVDKLMTKLEDKEKQLHEKNQAIEELLANLEKVRAVKAAPGIDELKRELAIAHKTNAAFQMKFLKPFPSPHLRYSINAPLSNGDYGYLYVDRNGYLCSLTEDEPVGHIQFKKNSDGTFSIYSTSTGKYLQIHISSSIMFCANFAQKSKFVLIFHPQQDKQQSGIMVDILVLANGCFLSAANDVNQQNRLVANSPIAPLNKFLILAEGVE